MLVVDARDWGRFLLLFDAAVFERDRDFGSLLSIGGWSEVFLWLVYF